MNSTPSHLPTPLQDAHRKLEKAGADQFELYMTRKTATKIECKEQKVDSLTRAEDVGLCVRVVKNGQIGFSFTTSLDRSAVERAVDSALEISRHMPRDEHTGLYSFRDARYPKIDAFDQTGLSVAVDHKVELAKRLENATRQADPRIAGIRSAAFGETALETHLVDSAGQHLLYQATYFSGSVTCKAESGGDSQMGGDFDFANELEKLDIEKIGKRAAGYATELLGSEQAPTMRCPAVFRNDVVSQLLEFLSDSFSAEQVDKGRSMLAGKMNERLFAETVTILDDGLLPGGYGTSPFDGEGVPSSTTTLVEGGTLKSFLYDTYYARKMKAKPTGNAARGIKGPPSIGITNLFLKAGARSFNDLISGISKGILITDLMGVHTANPVTGEFSLGASGILIDGGKLTRPVRGFAVAGNVLEVFRQITDTGSDLRFFGSVGAPSIRVSEISVGGS